MKRPYEQCNSCKNKTEVFVIEEEMHMNTGNL